jgi:hypothetical protein
MSVLTAALVAGMLTIVIDGVPQTPVVIPNLAACKAKADEINFTPTRRHGPVIYATCDALGAEEPAKPASAASAPNPKKE